MALFATVFITALVLFALLGLVLLLTKELWDGSILSLGSCEIEKFMLRF